MLSYQHGYHAGNFADVVKHLTLVRILSYLTLKNKPLFYLETHSGKGLYDLHHKQSEKTGEYKQGIQLLWDAREKMPPAISEYMQHIMQLNNSPHLRYYPGSPALAIASLRAMDRLYFCERHPGEYDLLRHLPTQNKKIYFNQCDGIAQLKAVLPPLEKRGFIFIDPSYEIKQEYKEIPKAIHNAYERFATGIYCLWYPIVHRRLSEQLTRAMRQIKTADALNVEFNFSLTAENGMTGCGLWVINPPYTLAKELDIVLSTLKSYFNPAQSSYVIEIITASDVRGKK